MDSVYTIVLQMQPRGSVVRIGLVMNPGHRYLQPLFLGEQTAMLTDGTPASPELPRAGSTQTLELSHPPATPSESVVLGDMFARLDALCGEMGDTLREVVLAFSFASAAQRRKDYVQREDHAYRRENARLLEMLRASMPRMVVRRRLTVRREDAPVSQEDVIKGVFERDAWFWKHLKLDG